MPRSVLRVGTRGSALALAQAESIRQAISAVVAHRNFELVPVSTLGDRITEPPAEGDGIFSHDLEEALASSKIDLAVHSAENLPARSVDGITLAAIPKRDDPRDVLVTRAGIGLQQLLPGTTVGTSSVRCMAQLLALGRGLAPTPIWGNLDDRLRRLSDGHVHALVVPLAGLKRLGRMDRVSEILPVNVMLPPVGQGSLAVQCRANDKLLRPALGELDDPDARAAFEAERSFMLALGADAASPLAALAEASGGKVRIRGLVATRDGKTIMREQIEGEDAEKTGIELADRMREAGAADLLARA